MKGFTKVDNNILFSQDLHPFSKLVLTSLTYYTRNGDGSCFARKTTLSRMIGISLYHLRNSLRELESKELIHIVRPGQGHPDHIYLADFKPASQTSSTLSSIIEEELKIEEEETITAEAVKEPTENDPILDQQITPAIRSNPEHLQTTAQHDEPITQLDRDYHKLLEDLANKRVKFFSQEDLDAYQHEDIKGIRSQETEGTEKIDSTGIKTIPADRQFGTDKGNSRRNLIEEEGGH